MERLGNVVETLSSMEPWPCPVVSTKHGELWDFASGERYWPVVVAKIGARGCTRVAVLIRVYRYYTYSNTRVIHAYCNMAIFILHFMPESKESEQTAHRSARRLLLILIYDLFFYRSISTGTGTGTLILMRGGTFCPSEQ